ncbi:asparagine synthetase B [Alteribacter lacisalsi]|uniref:asparagine synthase (glutamine-hydrolyzing) n=1 Tax=Alteribacter lacisalsi TaxID=2045244 RepID=A0A2W0HHP8_9BACI|nr:asparagine synthase-related protein [Alteribacter lacisalsi]PYZ96965.1 asparagine synthetase B [Alteribacter lacisalsi]
MVVSSLIRDHETADGIKVCLFKGTSLHNRIELLDKSGIRNPGGSVTNESLIEKMYERWSTNTPKFLVGEFAFVIWDNREQRYFGARDFSGSRTLYFVHKGNHFAFSPTMKPLLELPYVSTSLNEEWLAEFMAIPTMVESVDMRSTVYRDIQQVPPGHSITVENGQVKLERYSYIEVKEELKLSSDEEYEEAFRNVLGQAVRDRLPTEGHVGAHLSGGLDSGSVVSLAAPALKEQGKQLHTFSYVPEKGFVDWTDDFFTPDESPFIKETVNYVGNINPHLMRFEGRDPFSELDDFLDLIEMPYKFFDNSYWLKGISEEAGKRGITLMLNGARGNHSISWGSVWMNYDYYTTLLLKMNWFRLNRELSDFCTHFQTGKKDVLPFLLKKWWRSESNGGHSRFPEYINPHFARKTQVYQKLGDYGFDLSGAPVKDLSKYRREYYQQMYPWNKSGVINTKMGLRYGVWDSDPTNDIRVIKFCLSIPKEQYVKGGLERSIIRRATKGLLPDKVRLNQKTRGLQAADTILRMKRRWPKFKQELEDLKNDSMMAELLNMQVIKKALSSLGDEPKESLIFHNHFKVLIRSLILYRFLKRFS